MRSSTARSLVAEAEAGAAVALAPIRLLRQTPGHNQRADAPADKLAAVKPLAARVAVARVDVQEGKGQRRPRPMPPSHRRRRPMTREGSIARKTPARRGRA
jgi:hypothetical protein